MATCGHDAPYVLRACTHLLVADHDGYFEAFTGRGVESELLCGACTPNVDRTHVVDACAECAELARVTWNGTAGRPEIVTATSTLALHATDIAIADCPELADLCPLLGADRQRWLGVTNAGALVELDLDARSVRTVAELPEGAVDLARPLEVHAAPNGRYAAVCNVRGKAGAVIELASGRVVLPLVRDGYRVEHCNFPIAFLERGDRTLVVHAPGWNRLEVQDVATGELLTTRASTTYSRGEPQPDHYLDYFHCGLQISPGNRLLANSGWVWGPWGYVSVLDLERWLGENVWEAEDGPTRRSVASRGYSWDEPMCWLDDTRLAVFGYGEDDEWLLDAVSIYDVTKSRMRSWFAGPTRGRFAFDRVLHVLNGQRYTAWDVERGARVVDAPSKVARYHPSAKCAVSLPSGGTVTVAWIGGHHAEAAWNTPRVRVLADALVRDGDLEHGLVVLGDALEAAGCDDAELLAHCRAPGPHAARCWVLDRLA